MIDKVLVVCALLLAAGYAYMTEQVPTRAFGDPLGPRAFPRILAAALVVSVLLLLCEMIFRGGNETAGAAPDQAPQRAADDPWVVAATVAFTALYFFLFEPLGFVLTSSAYLFAMTTYFNPRMKATNALISFLLPAACYLIFTHVLGVQLAQGILPL